MKQLSKNYITYLTLALFWGGLLGTLTPAIASKQGISPVTSVATIMPLVRGCLFKPACYKEIAKSISLGVYKVSEVLADLIIIINEVGTSKQKTKPKNHTEMKDLRILIRQLEQKSQEKYLEIQKLKEIISHFLIIIAPQTPSSGV